MRDLLAYFHVDETRLLPLVLRMEYTGYNCFHRLRALMRSLEIPYVIYEKAMVR